MRKETYKKPQLDVIHLEPHDALLAASDLNQGGGNASGSGNPPLDTREFAWDGETEWE